MTDVRVARQEDVSALAALHLRSCLAAYSHIFPPDAPAPTFDRVLSRWQGWLGARGLRVRG